ncbi:hypothetical protein [Chryseobacterium vrystaatense]|uniref:Uncharacterized protein n=1 Tax=Chryseobacterium vrystaatense TaxID=307480 RepID=A0A1M5B2R4_9FLAO|nr:hypothetical protein [Chryseobacterium vrystaatense]SHF36759.1 hypothetical protein SAMN02787073_2109 [Chryseobacterium vrystaatense]
MSSEKPFSSIESRINLFPTVMLQGLLYFMLLAAFAFLILLPAYGIYKRGIEVMIFPALLCFPIGLGILIPSVKYYIIKRSEQPSKIIVNEVGLLYCNKKGEAVNKVLYADLVSSGKDFDISTVNTRSSGIIPMLEVFIASEKEGSAVSRIEMNLPLHVVRDRYTLFAHFLKGISTFRPDLKIAPQVFLNYFIDPETWQINRKGASYLFLLIIAAALLTCGIIMWLVMTFT